MTSDGNEADCEVIMFNLSLFQGQGSFVNCGTELLNVG